MLVRKLGDQRELVHDLRPDLVRHARRIAQRGARIDELAQPACRGFVFRDQLLRILVAQLIERERAAIRDPQAFREQRLGIDLRKAHAPAQVALGVREEGMPGFGERRADADRGERVLQRAARTRVHVRIARRDQRQPACVAQRRQLGEPHFVARAVMKFGGDPCPAGKTRGKPVRMPRIYPRTGHQQRKAAGQAIIEVRASETVAAFPCAPAAARDQFAEVAVAFPVGGEQHEPGAVRKGDLASHDQPEAVVFRGDMRAHDARERAFIGDRERRVAERLRLLDQFLGMRGAAQEAEVGNAVQFCIAGQRGLHAISRRCRADTSLSCPPNPVRDRPTAAPRWRRAR